MGLDVNLSEWAAKTKKETTVMMEANNDKLIPYMNKTEFPFFMIPKLQELKTCGLAIKGFGSPECNHLEAGALIFEVAKYDMSVATFFLVHNAIGMDVVD